MTLTVELSAVLQAVTDIVFVVDSEARIRYINHVLPGFDEATVIGSSSEDYLHPEHRADYRRRLQGLFATGEVDEYEIRSEAPHHQGFNWYFVRMRHIRGSEPPIAVISSTDITDRKRAEAHREALLGELQDAMAQLRALQAVVPMCDRCQAVRTADDRWEPLEGLAGRAGGAAAAQVCPSCTVQHPASL